MFGIIRTIPFSIKFGRRICNKITSNNSNNPRRSSSNNNNENAANNNVNRNVIELPAKLIPEQNDPQKAEFNFIFPLNLLTEQRLKQLYESYLSFYMPNKNSYVDALGSILASIVDNVSQKQMKLSLRQRLKKTQMEQEVGRKFSTEVQTRQMLSGVFCQVIKNPVNQENHYYHIYGKKSPDNNETNLLKRTGASIVVRNEQKNRRKSINFNTNNSLLPNKNFSNNVNSSNDNLPSSPPLTSSYSASANGIVNKLDGISKGNTPTNGGDDALSFNSFAQNVPASNMDERNSGLKIVPINNSNNIFNNTPNCEITNPLPICTKKISSNNTMDIQKENKKTALKTISSFSPLFGYVCLIFGMNFDYIDHYGDKLLASENPNFLDDKQKIIKSLSKEVLNIEKMQNEFIYNGSNSNVMYKENNVFLYIDSFGDNSNKNQNTEIEIDEMEDLNVSGIPSSEHQQLIINDDKTHSDEKLNKLSKPMLLASCSVPCHPDIFALHAAVGHTLLFVASTSLHYIHVFRLINNYSFIKRIYAKIVKYQKACEKRKELKNQAEIFRRRSTSAGGENETNLSTKQGAEIITDNDELQEYKSAERWSFDNILLYKKYFAICAKYNLIPCSLVYVDTLEYLNTSVTISGMSVVNNWLVVTGRDANVVTYSIDKIIENYLIKKRNEMINKTNDNDTESVFCGEERDINQQQIATSNENPLAQVVEIKTSEIDTKNCSKITDVVRNVGSEICSDSIGLLRHHGYKLKVPVADNKLNIISCDKAMTLSCKINETDGSCWNKSAIEENNGSADIVNVDPKKVNDNFDKMGLANIFFRSGVYPAEKSSEIILNSYRKNADDKPESEFEKKLKALRVAAQAPKRMMNRSNIISKLCSTTGIKDFNEDDNLTNNEESTFDFNDDTINYTELEDESALNDNTEASIFEDLDKIFVEKGVEDITGKSNDNVNDFENRNLIEGSFLLNFDTKSILQEAIANDSYETTGTDEEEKPEKDTQTSESNINSYGLEILDDDNEKNKEPLFCKNNISDLDDTDIQPKAGSSCNIFRDSKLSDYSGISTNKYQPDILEEAFAEKDMLTGQEAKSINLSELFAEEGADEVTESNDGMNAMDLLNLGDKPDAKSNNISKDNNFELSGEKHVSVQKSPYNDDDSPRAKEDETTVVPLNLMEVHASEDFTQAQSAAPNGNEMFENTFQIDKAVNINNDDQKNCEPDKYLNNKDINNEYIQDKSITDSLDNSSSSGDSLVLSDGNENPSIPETPAIKMRASVAEDLWRISVSNELKKKICNDETIEKPIDQVLNFNKPEEQNKEEVSSTLIDLNKKAPSSAITTQQAEIQDNYGNNQMLITSGLQVTDVSKRENFKSEVTLNKKQLYREKSEVSDNTQSQFSEASCGDENQNLLLTNKNSDKDNNKGENKRRKNEKNGSHILSDSYDDQTFVECNEPKNRKRNFCSCFPSFVIPVVTDITRY